MIDGIVVIMGQSRDLIDIHEVINIPSSNTVAYSFRVLFGNGTLECKRTLYMYLWAYILEEPITYEYLRKMSMTLT